MGMEHIDIIEGGVLHLLQWDVNLSNIFLSIMLLIQYNQPVTAYEFIDSIPKICHLMIT